MMEGTEVRERAKKRMKGICREKEKRDYKKKSEKSESGR